MQIAVISDTHGHVENTQKAVRRLETLELDAVLHCGDIGSAAIVPLFATWPTHFVFGNVDGEHDQLRAVIESAGQTCHGRFGELDFEGKRIALLHSDDGRRFQETIFSGDYDLVCHGHTHIADLRTEDDTIVLNPGAIYRATPHSFAVVRLPELEVTTVEL